MASAMWHRNIFFFLSRVVCCTTISVICNDVLALHILSNIFFSGALRHMKNVLIILRVGTIFFFVILQPLHRIELNSLRMSISTLLSDVEANQHCQNVILVVRVCYVPYYRKSFTSANAARAFILFSPCRWLM